MPNSKAWWYPSEDNTVVICWHTELWAFEEEIDDVKCGNTSDSSTEHYVDELTGNQTEDASWVPLGMGLEIYTVQLLF